MDFVVYVNKVKQIYGVLFIYRVSVKKSLLETAKVVEKNKKYIYKNIKVDISCTHGKSKKKPKKEFHSNI